MLWIGTERPLKECSSGATPDALSDYHRIEKVAEDAPVHARFTNPLVYYVGSHEGCGCGFHSTTMARQGMSSVAEVVGLLDALTAEERLEFEAEQASRERLRNLVEVASRDGTVEIYVCWAGDEGTPALATQEIWPSDLASQLEPFEEQTLYVVRRPA